MICCSFDTKSPNGLQRAGQRGTITLCLKLTRYLSNSLHTGFLIETPYLKLTLPLNNMLLAKDGNIYNIKQGMFPLNVCVEQEKLGHMLLQTTI